MKTNLLYLYRHPHKMGLTHGVQDVFERLCDEDKVTFVNVVNELSRQIIKDVQLRAMRRSIVDLKNKIREMEMDHSKLEASQE
jgi:hypothetical protein